MGGLSRQAASPRDQFDLGGIQGDTSDGALEQPGDHQNDRADPAAAMMYTIKLGTLENPPEEALRGIQRSTRFAHVIGRGDAIA